jgi:hypothetical protein
MPQTSPVAEVEPKGIEVVGAETETLALVDWALSRFHQAGLDLPDLVITFHEDKAPCSGNAGLFRHGDPNQVHLCATADRLDNARKLITLHELGHAWAETRTDKATRQAFLEERGLDSWTDPGQSAHFWGAEHAAEAVSWALMDEPVKIVRILDAEPERLDTAFRMLTGFAPLIGEEI